jgi:DnaJ-class molecular chaperone
MAKIKCDECDGNRRYTTGGHIYHDCEKCNGTGKVWQDEPKEFKIDKDSHHYKKAIRKIKALNKNISDKDAQEMFDKELDNLKDEKNDSGTQEVANL